MRDKTANSHETPMDLPDEEVAKLDFLVVWLGDDKEANISRYFGINNPGWYVAFTDALYPLGPFNTSKEAHDGWFKYLAEK